MIDVPEFSGQNEACLLSAIFVDPYVRHRPNVERDQCAPTRWWHTSGGRVFLRAVVFLGFAAVAWLLGSSSAQANGPADVEAPSVTLTTASQVVDHLIPQVEPARLVVAPATAALRPVVASTTDVVHAVQRIPNTPVGVASRPVTEVLVGAERPVPDAVPAAEHRVAMVPTGRLPGPSMGNADVPPPGPGNAIPGTSPAARGTVEVPPSPLPARPAPALPSGGSMNGNLAGQPGAHCTDGGAAAAVGVRSVSGAPVIRVLQDMADQGVPRERAVDPAVAPD